MQTPALPEYQTIKHPKLTRLIPSDRIFSGRIRHRSRRFNTAKLPDCAQSKLWVFNVVATGSGANLRGEEW